MAAAGDLPDMEAAAARIYKAASEGQHIGICGDFDVDGLSGTALLFNAIAALGGRPVPYIPNREQDGHGVALAAVRAFKEMGVRLMITVDTGTSAVDEIAAAKLAGIDTIVTDHHIPGPGTETGDSHGLPAAVAIINPHLAKSSTQSTLSGSGVAFKLATAVFAMARREVPEDAIALACLGTIADSAPLLGDNRIIVKFGLDQFGRTRHAGLRALLDHSRGRGRDGIPDTELVSFYVAPRLNSAGRLGDAGPSLRLLTTDDPAEAEALAGRLDALNGERQRLSQKAWDEVQPQLARLGPDEPLIVVRCSAPPGLLGPLAGKLCEVFSRPAIVAAPHDGAMRASARSTPDFDIYSAIFGQRNLLTRFGGHARAAGFEVRVQDFEMVAAEVVRSAAWSRLRTPEGATVAAADAEVAFDDLPASMWDFVEMLAPFGEGNRSPVFVTRGVRTSNVRPIGQAGKHLRLAVEAGDRSIEAVGFGLGDTVGLTGRADIAYSLRKNLWNGRVKRELELKAIRPA